MRGPREALLGLNVILPSPQPEGEIASVTPGYRQKAELSDMNKMSPLRNSGAGIHIWGGAGGRGRWPGWLFGHAEVWALFTRPELSLAQAYKIWGPGVPFVG